MNILEWLYALIKREPQVAQLVSNLEAQRAELASAAQQLKALVAKKEAAAAEALKRAAAHKADADWAQRVADKFADFIS